MIEDKLQNIAVISVPMSTRNSRSIAQSFVYVIRFIAHE